nr:hypothetical protein [Simonsiella muelleri]
MSPLRAPDTLPETATSCVASVVLILLSSEMWTLLMVGVASVTTLYA